MLQQRATFPIPNLHIVGFQKCGTTAMAHFLSQHDEICMVQGKEAHVFDDPDYNKASDKTAFALQKYRNKLTHFAGERYILDCTPVTLFHPIFIKSCVALNPQAKFIVMQRDPVDRAFSHYQMSKARKLEPHPVLMAFFLEPWRMRKRYKAMPFCPFEHPYRDHSYLSRGLYQRQLRSLYQEVAVNQVLLIKQESLASEHEKTLDAVFRFLSLAPVNIPKEKVFTRSNEHVENRAARLLAKLFFLLA